MIETTRCARETELLDALSSGCWPEACDEELRRHVARCAECREVALVAEAFLADRRETESEAALPPSGAMWWRMQLRMEREAKVVAEKTVGRVQGLVIGATLAAMTVVLIATSLVKMGWSWLTSAMPRLPEAAGFASMMPMTVLVAVGVAVLVFAPVALWLAFAKE